MEKISEIKSHEEIYAKPRNQTSNQRITNPVFHLLSLAREFLSQSSPDDNHVEKSFE